jgi:outer membrane protein assembly factor BamA
MKGNTRTRDEVLRREMRQLESAWFSAELVRKSRERLQRLGYFEDVTIETPAVPGSADQVDVDVTVTEKPAGNLSAGVGYSQSQGILFNASVTQNNFLGPVSGSRSGSTRAKRPSSIKSPIPTPSIRSTASVEASISPIAKRTSTS